MDIDSLRRALSRAALLGAMVLGLPASSPAQVAAATPLPSAEQILRRYETFLGGPAALSKVTTRTVISRRLEFGAAPKDTVLVRYSKTPGLSIMHFRALDGSFIQYVNGCDTTGGWGAAMGVGGPPKPGASSTDGICQQEAYYYGYLPLNLARLKGNVGRLEVKALIQIVPVDAGSAGSLAGGRGADLFPPGPRKAYLVLSVPARGGDEYVWLYFDAQTGALLRRADAGKGPAPAQPGMNPRYTDFLQYRDVGDGTRAPFQFVTTGPGVEQRGVQTSIVDNAPLADDVFRRPKDAAREDGGF